MFGFNAALKYLFSGCLKYYNARFFTKTGILCAVGNRIFSLNKWKWIHRSPIGMCGRCASFIKKQKNLRSSAQKVVLSGCKNTARLIGIGGDSTCENKSTAPPHRWSETCTAIWWPELNADVLRVVVQDVEEDDDDDNDGEAAEPLHKPLEPTAWAEGKRTWGHAKRMPLYKPNSNRPFISEYWDWIYENASI